VRQDEAQGADVLRCEVKAKPTEYNGIRYRSKSEAIVARAINLAGWAFNYEPKPPKGCDYTPDFIIECEFGWKKCLTVLLEYKPSQATVTYYENIEKELWPSGHFASKVDFLTETLPHMEKQFHGRWELAIVVYGSPWNEEGLNGGRVLCPPDEPWCHYHILGGHLLGIIADRISEHFDTSYRFDLKNDSSFTPAHQSINQNSQKQCSEIVFLRYQDITDKATFIRKLDYDIDCLIETQNFRPLTQQEYEKLTELNGLREVIKSREPSPQLAEAAAAAAK
jgi:hypothetical protein